MKSNQLFFIKYKIQYFDILIQKNYINRNYHYALHILFCYIYNLFNNFMF